MNILRWSDEKINSARKTGALGEDAAMQYLLEKGYKLVGRNWLCRLGEIDLIMDNDGVRVMVEVRTRAETEFGAGLETVADKKQIKLIRAAKAYQQAKNYWGDIRFDVISIEENPDGTFSLEHIENAFMAGR